ncbi:MAG: hypothetical protein LBR56_05040 [Sporomusaceae bacterium]|jgi:hypothetical protein|nr:hypothetical protein [Sporomusaceae bacterium]
MDERLEEFTLEGKNFFYLDLGRIRKNSEFLKLRAYAKPILAKYERKSVYAIFNLENILFDTETKGIFEQWGDYNRTYFKYLAVMEIDGIKKIMFAPLFKKYGSRFNTFYTKEQALEWLLQQE